MPLQGSPSPTAALPARTAAALESGSRADNGADTPGQPASAGLQPERAPAAERAQHEDEAEEDAENDEAGSQEDEEEGDDDYEEEEEEEEEENRIGEEDE